MYETCVKILYLSKWEKYIWEFFFKEDLLKKIMVVVKYYYMEGCPACIQFKPEWMKLIRKLKNDGIKFEEYKYGGPADYKTFTDAKITHFPTIKIYCWLNEEGTYKNQTYDGEFNAEALYNKIKRIIERENFLEQQKKEQIKSSKSKSKSYKRI